MNKSESTMSLQCAISGKLLTSENGSEIVVTPSGHLCLKRLLLTKLSENGGVDPFSDSGRPLSEDQLVSLQVSTSSPTAPPPPATVSSFSGTLQQLAKEYDAVLLELFDTRKALQDTRRELSQALYQNDAAIRVVARLSMERDAARQDAQRFQAAGGVPVNGGGSQPEEEEGQPRKKRAKVAPAAEEEEEIPMTNNIPQSDLQQMLDTWEDLHKERRAKPKSTYTLPEAWETLNTQSWHKSTCRGITAIARHSKWVVTAGKDKQLFVYNSESQTVATSFATKVLMPSVDVVAKSDDSLLVVAACASEIRVYDSSTQQLHGSYGMKEPVVHVAAHPTGSHCIAATKKGKLVIVRISNGVELLSTFLPPEEATEYTCGALHPDGLIYATGTSKGQVMVWDLKNKALGSTLPSELETEDKVVAIAYSSNGYHLATAHASASVRVWDLRKQKMVVELNNSEDGPLLKSVSALAFHEDGKYLAYGGNGGVHMTMVKEWKVSAQIDTDVATGLVWTPEWIATCSEKSRTVQFHAPPVVQMEE